ncbi:xylitol dehydrogenase [Microsporum canis CBS 113480]|uniref:Xylitol dehydrogenase n=1 Tax=Arthroderma otae (strain ATCC MYA-4605 / CBS 113480) TaxID=554155 RepID=C5FV37_ARTOC|nr:xylitol dehydrogenase [Microsporum canis CBS 113480]EEQ33771.1 xylitol dehydrogenase [Microsporum canis CBS 113480]
MYIVRSAGSSAAPRPDQTRLNHRPPETVMESISQPRALVLHGAQDLRLETRPIAPPAADEVQVIVRATGLCGSDLHYYHHGRNGNFILRQPLVLGHESIGEVVAVGPPSASASSPSSPSSAHSFRIGDRVALEVGLPCRKCLNCRLDRYNICRSLRFRSSAAVFPHVDGTLMDATNHPAAMCHKLPPSISDVQGALLEPLAVCLHAINRSNPPTVEDVALAKSVAAANGGAAADGETAALVFGAGAIGLLLTSALAISQHFTTIVVADINPARLEIASSLPFSCIRTFVLDCPRSTSAPRLQRKKTRLQRIWRQVYCSPSASAMASPACSTVRASPAAYEQASMPPRLVARWYRSVWAVQVFQPSRCLPRRCEKSIWLASFAMMVAAIRLP